MATAAAGSGSNDSDWEVLRDLSNKTHVPVGALEIFFILLFLIICGWTVFVVGREVWRVLTPDGVEGGAEACPRPAL